MESVDLKVIQDFVAALSPDLRMDRVRDVRLSGGIVEVDSLIPGDNAGLINGMMIVKRVFQIVSEPEAGEENAAVGVEETEPEEGSPPSDNEEVAEVVEN